MPYVTLQDVLNNPPAYVIFDYDQTIATLPVDWEKHRPLFREHLNSLGYKTEAWEGLRIEEMEQRALQNSPQEWDDIYIFRQKVESAVSGHHLPHPLICEAVQELHRKGTLLSILSNNLRETLEAGLKQLNLTSYFHTILGVDNTRDPKPGTKGFTILKEKLKLNPSQTVMMGDSPQTDGAFCSATGIHFVHITPQRG